MKYDEDGNLVENPNARWAITDTTRNDLRDLEAKAFEKGWSPDDLASRIEELIDDPARAKMIADTDLAEAQIQGSLEEMRESGLVEGKGWLVSNEGNTCEDCLGNADDGVIGLDELFSSGDDAPTIHPACSCDLYFELTGADE